MAIMQTKGTAETVRDLVNVLLTLPQDMPLRCGGSDTVSVYWLKPVSGETWDDERGAIMIEADDA